MQDPIQRVLGGTPGRPVLTFERRYRTEPEDLWQALTDPDRLARWFGRLDDPAPAGVGAQFSIDLGGGVEDRGVGVITACHRPERLAYDWRWQGEPTSQVDAVLVPDGDHTRLLLTHRLTERDHAVGYGGGWEEMLGALEHSLAPAMPAAHDGHAREVEGNVQWSRLLQLAGPDRELRISRTLPADTDQVWHALSTTEGLAAWWWAGLDTSYAVDLRLGGHYRFAAAAGGFAVTGTYLAIEPTTRLAFSWIWQDDDGASAPDRVDLTLRDGRVAGTTELEVHHRGPWEEAGQVEDYRLGWTSTLDALERACSG